MTAIASIYYYDHGFEYGENPEEHINLLKYFVINRRFSACIM